MKLPRYQERVWSNGFYWTRQPDYYQSRQFENYHQPYGAYLAHNPWLLQAHSQRSDLPKRKHINTYNKHLTRRPPLNLNAIYTIPEPESTFYHPVPPETRESRGAPSVGTQTTRMPLKRNSQLSSNWDAWSSSKEVPKRSSFVQSRSYTMATTNPNTSTSFPQQDFHHSNPDQMKILKEINRQANLIEKGMLVVKILGWIHILLALILLGLDWAKVVILWRALNDGNVKFFLAVRILYGIYALFLGIIAITVASINKRTLSQLLLLACAILMISIFVVPDATPLVQSIRELITMSEKNAFRDANSISDSLITIQQLPKADLQSVFNIIITYCAFVLAHYLITVGTFINCIFLLRT